MNNFLKAFACASLVTYSTSGLTHENHSDNAQSLILADGHAPIGVMGDHMHKTGEWMIGYRFMQMSMEDGLRGDDSISPEQVAAEVAHPYGPPNFVRMVPLKMDTDMHMLGFMYAPTDSVTLTFGTSYLSKTMRSVMFDMSGTMRMAESEAKSSGIGDSRVTALVSLIDKDGFRIHANLGLSLPTGSIDEEANTGRKGYGMQLGTGTYDFKPGVTYVGQHDQIGWGSQASATLALNDNKHDYKRKTSYALTGWASYRFVPSLSTSARIKHEKKGGISGRDEGIFAPMTGSNPENTGRTTTSLGLGANFVSSHGILRGHRFALEWLKPIEQKVEGVQLEMQDMLVLGYQYAW